jgi:hypothetical protein
MTRICLVICILNEETERSYPKIIGMNFLIVRNVSVPIETSQIAKYADTETELKSTIEGH